MAGTFAGLPPGGVGNLCAFTAQISDQGSSPTLATTGGNDVVLYNFQPVPEPAHALLLCAAAAVASLRRRASVVAPVTAP